MRDFARARGQLAKTDAIDAATLADYGRTFAPEVSRASSEAQQQLRDLSRRREHLVRLRVCQKNALEKCDNALIKREISGMIVYLDRRVVTCDKQIAKVVEGDEKLVRKRDRLEKAQGIGRVASITLLAEVPELGRMTSRQAASLVGLAPLNRDSGKWRGTRTIHGGRAIARRALYMPALCATRHNPVLKEFYQQLRARGKAHHVALTAVMRKLVCLANLLLSDPTFELQGV